MNYKDMAQSAHDKFTSMRQDGGPGSGRGRGRSHITEFERARKLRESGKESRVHPVAQFEKAVKKNPSGYPNHPINKKK